MSMSSLPKLCVDVIAAAAVDVATAARVDVVAAAALCHCQPCVNVAIAATLCRCRRCVVAAATCNLSSISGHKIRKLLAFSTKPNVAVPS